MGLHAGLDLCQNPVPAQQAIQNRNDERQHDQRAGEAQHTALLEDVFDDLRYLKRQTEHPLV